MFFWNSVAFPMTQQILAIESLDPLPFINPACTSGSSQFMYCWRLAGSFEHCLVRIENEHICLIVGGSDGKASSTMRETRVQALGGEDPLEKEMAIHSSTIAKKIPWTEEPGRLQSMGWRRVGHDWATSLSFSFPGIAFLWDWNENWPFPVLWPLLFSKFADIVSATL